MKTILTTLLVLATTCLLSAQDMPEMKPPAEVKNLSWLLGEWSGDMTMSDPGGMNMKVKATIKATMSLEGRYVESRHTFTGEGMPPWAGLHLATYDPQSKSYKAWWFDSMAPGVMEMEGTWANNVLTMTSKPTEMPGMGAIVMRATWTKKGEREIHFTLQMKDGEKWNTFIEADFKKK